MLRIAVLGGCGAVGSVAVRMLAASDVFSEIVVGDIDFEKAQRFVESLGSDKVTAVRFDASKRESIKEAIEGSQVVLNCVGPFYEFGPPILKAVIEAGMDYVDLCDDFDATEKVLKLDGEAKRKGVSALIGMGSSPGISNVLVRFCADALLDEIESVDIYHAHGGEKVEGTAVVKHRIHSMMIDIPMFLDGKFTTVRLFDESGKALEDEVDFPGLGRYRVYAYPHPETITLPRYLKITNRVTNLGTVLPPAYAELIKGMVRLGLTAETPLDVGGQKVIPLEFAVSFILSQRKRLLEEAGIAEPMGCLKIVVAGKKGGEENTYVFSMSSRGRGMVEGTGIPAALGAMLMGLGKIELKGVFPPEVGVRPLDLLELAQKQVKIEGERGLPIRVQHIDRKGNVRQLDIRQLVGG